MLPVYQSNVIVDDLWVPHYSVFLFSLRNVNALELLRCCSSRRLCQHVPSFLSCYTPFAGDKVVHDVLVFFVCVVSEYSRRIGQFFDYFAPYKMSADVVKGLIRWNFWTVLCMFCLQQVCPLLTFDIFAFSKVIKPVMFFPLIFTFRFQAIQLSMYAVFHRSLQSVLALAGDDCYTTLSPWAPHLMSWKAKCRGRNSVLGKRFWSSLYSLIVLAPVPLLYEFHSLAGFLSCSGYAM